MAWYWVVLLIFTVLVLLYLWAIRPGKKRDMGEMTNRLYAHRGLWNAQRPENSLSAMRAAVQAGYGIETDVHLTADEQPVLMHDGNLKRMCGADVVIEQSTLAELSRYHLLDTQEKIPTLDELLDTVQGRVPLLLELKSDHPNDRLCELVAERMDRYEGPWMMESFNPLIVRWFRKNRPQVLRGQLGFGMTVRGRYPTALHRLLSTLIGNAFSRPDFLAYDYETDRSLPFRLARLYRPHLAAWTVRSPEALQRNAGTYEIQIFEGFEPKKET